MQKTYLTNLCKENPNAVIIGSIGTICYDLTDIPHNNKILIRGAMGSVMGIALGYAMNSDKQVICVIGDGSFIMKMGFMATYLKYRPKNLQIIIINNNCFKSCGSQETNFKGIEGIVNMFFKVINIKDPLSP